VVNNKDITDEEYEEFIKFIKEYNNKKSNKHNKFKDSLIYTIYKYLKR
jgi:hypothetical protein